MRNGETRPYGRGMGALACKELPSNDFLACNTGLSRAEREFFCGALHISTLQVGDDKIGS